MQIDQTGTVLQIQAQYAKRQKNGAERKYIAHPVYQNYIIKERETLYEKHLRSLQRPIENLTFLEVGAGLGLNIPFFEKCGIRASNIYVNELLDDRIDALHSSLNTRNIYPGDALDLPFQNEFDVVFQSTVFTSILSEPFRIALANKMWKMLKDDGIVLWYDFVFNNPNNPDVRKASRGDVLKYFPQAKHIEFHSVTLAPPVGRRIGHAYEWMNALFPFLRSHLIAVIHK